MTTKVTENHSDYLHEVLQRVADHMAELSKTLSATEDFMTEHFHDILEIRPSAMHDFQKLDFLNQSIIDTSKLLKKLSSGCIDQEHLLASLQLESTQQLVVPGQHQAGRDNPLGEVDLF
jgi:hypothetical protein